MNTFAKIILIKLALFLVTTSIYGQSRKPDITMTKPSFMYYHNKEVIKLMKVDYNLPKGFKEECYMEDFRSNKVQNDYFRRDLKFLGIIDGRVTSGDKNFTILFDIPHTLGSDSLAGLENNHHLKFIKSILLRKTVKYKLDYREIRKKTDYCFNECAKSRFNADTVITFQMKMPRGVTYFQYNHFKVIMLQKNNRSFISMLCFYNDIAKVNLNYYIKALDGMFWFRDED